MTNTATESRNEVVVTIDQRDIAIPLDSMSLTMDSSEREILDAVRPVVQQREGLDIYDTSEYSFTVRKALNSNTIYVYPKAPAG